MLGVSRGGAEGAENGFSLERPTGLSWGRSLLWFRAETRRTAESAELLLPLWGCGVRSLRHTANISGLMTEGVDWESMAS
jgi:hypothetical protein